MVRSWSLAALLGASLLACGGDGGAGSGGGGGEGAGGEDACPPPSRVVGDRCLAPGVQDDGCPAGELGLGNGACRPAGIPAELCGEGFVHDGDAGCDPVLPAEECPPEQMAIPGETTCRPVMDCGAGTWGDIPVDANTVFVDQSYAGGNSDGSMAQPYLTIAEALAAAPAGALVAVAAGTYAEDVVIDEPVHLWGVCPDVVSVVGQGNSVGVIDIREASGTEVVGLGVTSDANVVAVLVAGAEDVVLDRLWVHDTSGRGINLQNDLGPTSARIERSLVERAGSFGIFVGGSVATIDGVVVRDTLPRASDQELGRGINFQPNPDSGFATTGSLTASVIEGNRNQGVFIEGSEVTIKGVVVRDTLPEQSTQYTGRGIDVVAHAFAGPGVVSVSGSVVERNHDVGIVASGSVLSLEGVVIRDTVIAPGEPEGGEGIVAQAHPDYGLSVAEIASVLVERNQDGGIGFKGAEGIIEGVVVRDTLPGGIERPLGRGITVQPDPMGVPSTATITGSLLERNMEHGVVVTGSPVTLTGLLVRDTLPRADGEDFGRGIHIQIDFDTEAPAPATVSNSIIERNHDMGVLVLRVDATLSGLLIRDTMTEAASGFFGDGLTILGSSTTTVAHSVSEGSARAGLANFFSNVALEGVHLRCNDIELAGENVGDSSFSFTDMGGNLCGCEPAAEACKAISSGLTPPEAVDE
jgi:hypothetical protein